MQIVVKAKFYFHLECLAIKIQSSLDLVLT